MITSIDRIQNLPAPSSAPSTSVRRQRFRRRCCRWRCQQSIFVSSVHDGGGGLLVLNKLRSMISLLVSLLLGGSGQLAPVGSGIKGSAYIAVTMDGFIATPDGRVDFLDRFHENSEDDMGFREFMSSVDAIVMGRNSFEEVLFAFGQDLWAYGEKRMVICSRSPAPNNLPEYCAQHVSYSHREPTDIMTQLLAEGYSHVYVDGGHTIRRFLQAGVLHELHLTRVPLLIGEGIPLFGEGTTAELEHVDTKAFDSGLAMSRYKVLQSR